MAIGFWDKRYLIRSINSVDLTTQPRFFLETFFPNSQSLYAETIDIEYNAGSRKLARLRYKGQEANVVSKVGRTIKTFKLPYIREKKEITAKVLLDESEAGQIYINSPGGIAAVRVKAIDRELTDLKNRIQLREEWLAAQMLQTGGFTYDDGEVKYDLDLGWSATYSPVLSGADQWDESTSKVDRDLRAWAALMMDATGAGAKWLILGTTAAEAFLGNVGVKGNLDNLNYKTGALSLDVNSNYLGYYNGVQVYVYSRAFTKDDNTTGNMMPTDMALLISASFESERLYGDIVEVDGPNSDPFFSKSWVENDPSVRWLLAASSPLPMVYREGSVIAATVI